MVKENGKTSKEKIDRERERIMKKDSLMAKLWMSVNVVYFDQQMGTDFIW